MRLKPNHPVIINNYATPYREDLFNAIQGTGTATVVYVTQPEAKRREIGWRAAQSQQHQIFQLNEPVLVQQGSGRRLIVPLETIVLMARLRPKTIVCTLSRDMVLVQIVALGLAKILRAKIAFWVGDVGAIHSAGGVAGLIDRLRLFCARRADGFVFYSTKSRNWLHDQLPEAACRPAWVGGQVRHPISVLTPHSRRRGRPVFRLLFVGGEIPRKGMAELLDDLSSRPTVLGKPVELLCVGGAKRGRTRHAGIRLVSLGKLDFHAMQQAYELADAVIIASLEEPWGFVFNEAILAGKACVVSTHAGSATVADKYGLAYEVGKPDSLNHALLRASVLTRAEMNAIADELSVARAAKSFELFMAALDEPFAQLIQDY